MPTEQNSYIWRKPAEMGLCAREPQGAQSSGYGIKTKRRFIGPGIKRPGTHFSLLPTWDTRCLLDHTIGHKGILWPPKKTLNFQVFNKISGGKTVLLSKGQAMLEASLKKKKKKTTSTSSNYLELCMFTAIYNRQNVARLSSSWWG